MKEHDNCELMKKLGMRSALGYYSKNFTEPDFVKLSIADALNILLNIELNGRVERKYQRELKSAKFKFPNARIEELDYRSERNLSHSVITGLSSLSWLEKKQNIIIVGLTGTGKTYLSNALGELCIRKGKRVYFYRLTHLLEEAELARADGSFRKLKERIEKAAAIVVDDIGLVPITPQGCHDLLDFIDSKSTTGSVILTSQLPIDSWHEWLGEPTVADAILDRLVHKAHVIELKGDSMRKITESVDGGEK